MSEKVLGDASEFYRLRLVRLDEGGEPDLEWREDILWRRPPVQAVEEYEVWRVQVVDVVTDDVVGGLADFEDADEAHAWMGTVQEDLDALTKAEFDERYLSAES